MPRRIVRPEASCPRGLWDQAGKSARRTAETAVVEGKRVCFFINALGQENIGASLLADQLSRDVHVKPFLLDEQTPGVATNKSAAAFYCHDFMPPDADYLVYLSAEIFLGELPPLAFADIALYHLPSVIDQIYDGFFLASRDMLPLFDWCRDLRPDEAFPAFIKLARASCRIARLPEGLFFPMRSATRSPSSMVSLSGVKTEARNRLIRQMHQSPRPWREVCRHFAWTKELGTAAPYPQGTKIDINCEHAGIGDLIDVAHIASAIERENPGVSVQVYAKKAKSGFVSLFGHYGPVRGQSLVHELPPAIWHSMDVDRKGRGSRIENWAAYCGASAPALAKPIISDESEAWADEFLSDLSKPAVVLSPISTCKMRSWPLANYEALAELLEAEGFGVAVMDDPDGLATKDTRFKRLFGVGAEREAAVIRKCALMVGNDSGMVHLSASLEIPTLVLCGPTDGRKIFTWYKAAKWIEGPLPCTGCYFYKENGWSVECEHGCLSLNSVGIETVLKACLEMLDS